MCSSVLNDESGEEKKKINTYTERKREDDNRRQES